MPDAALEDAATKGREVLLELAAVGARAVKGKSARGRGRDLRVE